MKFGIAAIIATIALIVVVYFASSVSYNNQEKQLRNLFNAKQNSNKIDYDAAWKIIAGNAEVSTNYSKEFRDSYSKIIASGDGSQNAIKNLFSTGVGINPPTLDSSLFKEVQNAITSQRTKFANVQRDLLEIKTQHDNLRTQFPGSLFLGGVPELEAKIVTSTKTEKSFDSGKDDDVKVY